VFNKIIAPRRLEKKSETKHEILNNGVQTNQNRRKFKTPIRLEFVGSLLMEFVSYFGFRVSNLRLLPISRVLRDSGEAF